MANADDCLFCKIRDGEIPSDKVYEDDDVLAFRDINPQAPVHILVIPKRHVASVADLTPGDVTLAGKLQVALAEIARQQGLRDGFRVVANTGKHGQQTVFHLHYHLLGGRQLTWPPG